jgi:hypothetical protein
MQLLQSEEQGQADLALMANHHSINPSRQGTSFSSKEGMESARTHT